MCVNTQHIRLFRPFKEFPLLKVPVSLRQKQADELKVQQWGKYIVSGLPLQPANLPLLVIARYSEAIQTQPILDCFANTLAMTDVVELKKISLFHNLCKSV